MTSVTRAIGAFITTVTGLPCFEGETANRDRTLPCVEVAMGESTVVRKFCGLGAHWYIPATEDTAAKAVKQIHRLATIRLTVVGKGEIDGSSEAKTVAHRDAIVTALENAVYGSGGPVIRDPKFPSTSPGIYRLRVGSIFGVRPDLTREPIVHEASVNITVQYRETYTRDIDASITDVIPDYEAAFA